MGSSDPDEDQKARKIRLKIEQEARKRGLDPEQYRSDQGRRGADRPQRGVRTIHAEALFRLKEVLPATVYSLTGYLTRLVAVARRIL